MNKETRLIKRVSIIALLFAISASGCSGKGCTQESPHTGALNENTPFIASSPIVSPEESATAKPAQELQIEETPPVTPSPDVSPSSDMPVSAEKPVNLLVGYWASIYQGIDGTDHLNGFYFAEDGTGLVFHASEGARPITSYSYSSNELLLQFLNMEDMPAEWLYCVDSLTENGLILSDGYIGEWESYLHDRMLMIEPYNCTGGYMVTRLDGTVFEIIGY